MTTPTFSASILVARIGAEMRKIIITGAYGNGNIGDEYQALSLARHLQRVAPGTEIYAKSLLNDKSDFEFPPRFRIPTRPLDSIEAIIRDAQEINRFDGLIIGGGGLLAADHKPLFFTEWTHAVNVPFALISIGADERSAGRASHLIKKARCVSARDSFSVEKLSAFRSDTAFSPDPILSDTALNLTPRSPSNHVCFIPRRAVGKNVAAYRKLAQLLRPSDFILSMFPLVDFQSGLREIFVKQDIYSVNTINMLSKYLKEARFVISERYHGCIVALKMGVPCLGVVTATQPETSKIYNLYQQLGIPDLLLWPRREHFTLEDLNRRASKHDSSRYFRTIQDFRLLIETEIVRFLKCL
jgi:polysaccharide pyruvyl transferase WcaK-like protein